MHLVAGLMPRQGANRRQLIDVSLARQSFSLSPKLIENILLGED